jgi:N-acetylmuramoyl-L-alanine amidase
LTLDDESWSRQAVAANAFAADVYVGLAITSEAPTITYYATSGFESAGGRRLAELLVDELVPVVSIGAPVGMRIPILRETRMPAVLCEFDDVASVVSLAPNLANAVVSTLKSWLRPAANTS